MGDEAEVIAYYSSELKPGLVTRWNFERGEKV
jgi:hypothetical protein